MLDARLICTTCGTEALLRQEGACRSCHGSLQARGEVWPVRIDRAARHPLTRYGAFLALDPTDTSLSLGEGGTPRVAARLGRSIRGGRLDLKLETLNPNGSAFDRGAVACVSRARGLGFTQVLVTQPGIATSVAAYAARAGMGCTVLLPTASGSEARHAVVLPNARVIRLETTPDKLISGLDQYCGTARAYLIERRDPFWIEGIKTLAYEVMETSGPEPTHHIVVPEDWQSEAVALASGFCDWRAAGLSECVPHISMARLPDSRNGSAGSEREFPCRDIDLREALAAQSLLAEEDGLMVDEGQAAVVAAAIKVAREAALAQPQRIVAILDGPSSPTRLMEQVELIENCTPEELPGRLAAPRPLTRAVD